MNVLYFLVPLALLLAGIGVAAFVWSVRSGQFDDVQTPGMRVLLENELEEQGSSHRMSTAHDERHERGASEKRVDPEQDDQPAR